MAQKISSLEIVNFNKWLLNFKKPANEIITYVIFIASFFGALITILINVPWDNLKTIITPGFLFQFNFWLHMILGIVVALVDVRVYMKTPSSNAKKTIEKYIKINPNDENFDLESSYNRANNEIKQFYLFWRFTWICWVFLYGILLLEHYEVGDPMKIEIAKNFTNNLASLMLLYCFMTLSIPSKTDESNHLSAWLPYLFILIFLTFIAVIIRSISSIESNVNFIFSLISGILGSAVTALLIGRLDSKLISGPIWVLFLFYIYAGIQGFFAFFEVHSRVDFDKEYHELLEASTIVIIYLALFFKCLLLLFINWSIKSRKLFYYFISCNKVYRMIADNWLEINSNLTEESTTKTN